MSEPYKKVMNTIAVTACIDEAARLGDDVIIGPGCVVGAGVVIGDGCELKANVIIYDGVVMGRGNRIHANCVIGDDPQMFGVNQPDTELVIGDENIIRENVTINRGSPHGIGKTIVGNRNFLMAGCHIGHDCEVEDEVVLSNCSQLAGHVKVERNSWVGALSGVHQFVTVGRYSYMGGASGSTHDLPPFMRAVGVYPCKVRGVNVVGLQRAGFGKASIRALIQAYKRLYLKPAVSIRNEVEVMQQEDGLDEHVRYLLTFLGRSFQHSQARYLETLRTH